MVSMAVIDCD